MDPSLHGSFVKYHTEFSLIISTTESAGAAEPFGESSVSTISDRPHGPLQHRPCSTYWEGPVQGDVYKAGPSRNHQQLENLTASADLVARIPQLAPSIITG